MARSGMSRRDFLRIGGGAGVGLFFIGQIAGVPFKVPVSGGTDPGWFARPDDPPQVRDADADPAGDAAGRHDHDAGRQAGRLLRDLGAAVRRSRSCPPASRPRRCGATARKSAQSNRGLLIHNAPSLTIEATVQPAGARQVDQRARRRRRQLPAPPAAGRPDAALGQPARAASAGRDTRPTFTSTPGPYTGPVPIVTHVHGAVGVGDESDGYAEAWYLPAADNIPAGFATGRHLVRLLQGQGGGEASARAWGPGSPSSSTRTPSGPRRSGTTTTRSA